MKDGSVHETDFEMDIRPKQVVVPLDHAASALTYRNDEDLGQRQFARYEKEISSPGTNEKRGKR
jgi:hypothetical protein